MVSVTEDISALLPRSGMHQSIECERLLQIRVLGLACFRMGMSGSASL
jgi:hypothetical protein